MEDRKLDFVDDFSAPTWYTILCLIMSKGRAGKDCPYEMLEDVPYALQLIFLADASVFRFCRKHKSRGE